MQQVAMEDGGKGEVRDIRARNRGLKIAAGVVLILLLVLAIAVAVYFFVFHDNDNYPHLEYYPQPSRGDLISYKQHDSADGEKWATKIDKFLEDYRRLGENFTRVRCGSDYLKPDGSGKYPCYVDVSHLADCSSLNSRYGYIEGRATPCVILKLNKLVNFKPEPFLDINDVENSTMPVDLAHHIKRLNSTGTPLSKRMLNTTWITCEGEKDVDKENIGVLNYFNPGFLHAPVPRYTGIPYMYFPYLEQEGYMEPFLFVKFLTPNRNVVITVKCQAWAKNIDPEDGAVTFQLLID